MKNLKLIIISLIIISCSVSTDREAIDLSIKICSDFKSELSAASILKAKKDFQTDFIEKKNLKPEKKTDYYNLIRKCLAQNNFNKPISNYHGVPYKISSNKECIVLTNTSFDIKLEGEQTPAFNMKLNFKVNNELPDTTNLEISGKIMLYDSLRQIIGEYSIYPTPEIYRKIKSGAGEFSHIVYFDPMWNSYIENPFDKAAEATTKINKAVYFEIFINYTGNAKLSSVPGNSKVLPEKEELIDKVTF